MGPKTAPPVPGQQRNPAQKKKPCPCPLSRVSNRWVNFPKIRYLMKDKLKVKSQARGPTGCSQALLWADHGSWPSGLTPVNA